jgi:dCTP deaminase
MFEFIKNKFKKSSLVLSDKTIMEYNKKGLLIEQPIKEEQLQPNSVDLTLGNTYKILKPNSRLFCINILDPLVPMKFESGTFDTGIVYDYHTEGYYYESSEYNDIRDNKERERFLLYTNQFILMASNEILNIPNGIIGVVCGRSSIARLGIIVEEAGLIDAGFRGTITLEIYNQLNYPILLYPGMRIAQVYFFRAEEASVIYGINRKSKYSNQIEAMQSKLYLDEEFKNK